MASTEFLRRFDEEHLRLFTFNMDTPHEIVNLRAVALGQALDLPAARIAERQRQSGRRQDARPHTCGWTARNRPQSSMTAANC